MPYRLMATTETSCKKRDCLLDHLRVEEGREGARTRGYNVAVAATDSDNGPA